MPAFWERHFLRYELALATLLVIGLAAWSTLCETDLLAKMLHGNRAAIYSTGAAITSALLGFLITTLAIIHGLIDRVQFDRLRASTQYGTMWSVLRWTIRGLAMSIVVLFVGLVVDRDPAPVWGVFYVAMWALVACLFLVGRTIWILERIFRAYAAA